MDIVARLRMWAAWDYMTESASADLLTAAEDIERLREALTVYSCGCSKICAITGGANCGYTATAALKEKE